MQTFPKNVKPGSNATLASLVYGNRFHADQTLIEYLIEFLLIFCAEKDSEGNGKLAFHNPYSHEELSYTVEPRMGLKRFIFFDKSKRNDSATVDKIAYKELLSALSNKIDDADSTERTEFLEALQDLFHGYAVVIKKRTWCAQAMMPVCPEVIFCEAMPKKKVRETLNWDKLCNDPDVKQRKKIDTEFDFDKRNFLARGGELYYLHILLGLQGQEEKQAKLEWLLKYLLTVQGKKMSNIAAFIQKTWEETMDYDKSPKQRLRLAYIPEQAYRKIALDSVDELISFLSCNMHPIKKLGLFANGIMLQVMRMLAVATTTYIGAPRECWIIDMKGSTEDIIKKIAASNFRNVENTFVTALGQQSIQMERENIERRMQEVRKARKDSLEIFRSKGKELQCIIPTTGPYERFSLPEDCIRFLVLAIIRPGNKMTVDMFLSKLYSKIFKDCFTFELEKDKEIACINKMYKNLFEFVAPDIFKMSQQADRWHKSFDSIGEFIGEFFSFLPEWGLQRRILKPVKQKEVEKAGNFLRGQYQFISRKLFQKVSKAQYQNCTDKLKKYNEEDRTYSNVWDGWPTQGFHNYDEFAKTLLEFIRGENIQSNLTKFLGVDYTIIDEILNIKLPKTAKTLVKDYSVTGDPLRAFLSAAFHIMQEGKGFGVSELAEVRFEFDHAEVVTGYTDADDREKQEQLVSTWSNICIHTDGIFSFIDTPNWSYNGGSLSIVCANPNFFSVDSINDNINSIVKTASATNTLNKVYFVVRGVDADGNVATYLPKGQDKNDELEHRFCWKFSSDEAWLYDFMGITQQDFATYDGGSVLPIGILDKIRSTLGFKGKDEFFNFYDDAEVDYSFDLIKYIKARTSNLKPGSNMLIFKVMFEDMAQYFCAVIRNIAKRGFYSCIGEDDMRSFFKSYNDLAQKILTTAFPENQLWILSAFIHAFNIEECRFHHAACRGKSKSCLRRRSNSTEY